MEARGEAPNPEGERARWFARRYLVETTDDDHGGFTGPPRRHGAMTARADSGPGVAFGLAPWTPLGSPLLGAILLALIIIGASLVPGYAWSRISPRVRSRLRRLNARPPVPARLIETRARLVSNQRPLAV